MFRPCPSATRHLLVALACGLLAGCATTPRPGEPRLSPAGRRAAIEAVDTWEARGRIALKTAGASGQGSFTWLQTGDRTVLRVAGPFGAEAREIRWDPDRLTVLSGQGEVAVDYAGPDAAERFLEEQLGWSLPMADARRWLVGLAGLASPASETLDSTGLLASLTQDGWVVSFDEYRTEGRIALPRKLVLQSAVGRIRLVIDQWRF
ncbi:MAG: outer membrane lipoprotein LolB [Gammaproteobacteria bacterium]|nr:outer membrane lipoprotein LolB [Gammaproteobacteria bacterium]